MTSPPPGPADTAHAISPDSGAHWAEPGAWPVADGIHRIPLPLPMDGLKAVNVYALETESGLTLVDGGWAITEARQALEAGLGRIGFTVGDIRHFLVTHVHRDHYTLASVLGREVGATVSLGAGEKPTLDFLNTVDLASADPTVAALVAAGAGRVAEKWSKLHDGRLPDREHWRYPDTWLEGDHEVAVGSRTLDAVHTPGHTQGHYVFAERTAALLFSGDHVLPTITPSIGFETPPVQQPLRDFLGSLAKVRALPDLTLLPAHGPVAPSSHTRVEQLLVHHDERLRLSLEALAHGPRTAYDVAGELPWTRHAHAFSSLDLFNAALASMETKAHLELLVAQGRAAREVTPDGVLFAAVSG
ncbi:MBL fold metallo-hydrolase [Nocardioides ferulae]|uniref:MBL fold metallo-hydrolase n=1 Tax=Nocardioides ferulae TaxID=2340821 RepID=UPI000EB3C426|nr:MBL fold metallo-hydrolase [Nocardioides ferulae]